MGDLPCTGTLVSPTGEELNSGLDDAHFRDTSSRCFFHDLQSLSCVSKGTMGGCRLTGPISPLPTSTATLGMITSKVSTTRKLFFLLTSTPTMPTSEPELMRTLFPATGYGWGSNLRRARASRSDSISEVGKTDGSPLEPQSTARRKALPIMGKALPSSVR